MFELFLYCFIIHLFICRFMLSHYIDSVASNVKKPSEDILITWWQQRHYSITEFQIYCTPFPQLSLKHISYIYFDTGLRHVVLHTYVFCQLYINIVDSGGASSDSLPAGVPHLNYSYSRIVISSHWMELPAAQPWLRHRYLRCPPPAIRVCRLHNATCQLPITTSNYIENSKYLYRRYKTVWVSYL